MTHPTPRFYADLNELANVILYPDADTDHAAMSNAVDELVEYVAQEAYSECYNAIAKIDNRHPDLTLRQTFKDECLRAISALKEPHAAGLKVTP